MRNQFLIITTILVVGTASASALAFYSSPNKTIAILGDPVNTNIPPRSTVAGVSTEKVTSIIPKEIPLLPNCDVLSFSRNNNNYQIMCQTKLSLFLAAKNYGNLIKTSKWENIETLFKGDVYTIKADKNGEFLEIRSFSDHNAQTMIAITYQSN